MKISNAILVIWTIWEAGCTVVPAMAGQAMEEEIWRESNRWRLRHERLPLTLDPSLSRLARRYSEDMARRHFFSHIDPDGRNVRERLWAAGFSFRAAGENLARVLNGPVEPSQVLATWSESPRHRESLLMSGYQETGVGIFRAATGEYYITQIFLEPYSSKRTR